MAKEPEISMAPAHPVRNRYEVILDLYLIGLSIVMMIFGLMQWAVILGIIDGGGGSFEAMTTGWKIVTIHLAVVDLVASVGLWMRVAWGRVVWVYAAVSEIVFHTALAGSFGIDLPKIVFHFTTLALFVVLTFLARRHNRY